MKKHFTTIVLVLAIAFIAAGSVFAISLPSLSLVPDNGLSLLPGDNCGDLRMDEFYACQNGGWQPTAVPTEQAISVDFSCDDLRLDEYYACRASGWRPGDDTPVLAK
jgi:hypothetical protein